MKLMHCKYCYSKKYVDNSVVCAICKYCLNEMVELNIDIGIKLNEKIQGR